MLKYINRSTAQAIGVGENPLNGSGKHLFGDEDIVSTLYENIGSS
mgnify:CR=1 FL=1